MRKTGRERNTQGSTRGQFLRLLTAMALLTAIGVGVFLYVFGRYNDHILYAERLNQMQDVTAQLFTGLEEVVATQWNEVDVLSNYVELGKPEDTEDLRRFMEKQAALNNFDLELDNLVAVDSRGRYYTPEGMKGTLQELDYLLDEPERISYVSNTLTTNRTKMVFLKRLQTPVVLKDGTELLYYGVSRDMTQLEPYFDCAAYDGSSGVYVVDRQGLKLFASSGSYDDGGLIKGYNVYNVLENMQYLHNSSFDSAKAELEANGRAYSNAILNGKEYYYSLYRMNSAEWVLVFLVRSEAVAMNTVKLVNTTLRVVLIFALCMAGACAGVILWMQSRQQRRELDAAARNNAELAKLNGELEAANRAKSDFLANMSHDIRTPMNAIVGITNLMETEADASDKLHTYIHKVQLSSRHLLSLINDILDMSKIESSDVVLNREAISLAEQVGQVDSIIRSQTNERGQSFLIRVHTISHEYLIGDGVRLRQVLLNLLSNAVKYTPYGGSIYLDIAELPCDREGQASFRISVTDNGYGMSKEFQKHIFEPFTRAEDSVTNRVQGTGLGMAITKSIVDLMGGTISVESELNKGSRFDVTLTLPIDGERECEIDARGVVLVSVDRVLIENVRASLEKAKIPLYVVATEREAENVLRDTEADIVLLNDCLQSPQLENGVRQLRRVKPGCMIFCLDYAQPEQVHEILVQSGVDGLISRPFFLSWLVQAMERVRSGSQPEAQEESSVLKGMRFLCAEDNALNAEILEAILELNGASCVIYADGEQLVRAFAKVKPGEYDAILMDVQMPVMNGLEATKVIRSGENPLGRTIPIIAMTANAFSSDVQACLDVGMDAHVSKPLDMDVFQRTVRAVMNGNFSGGGGTLVRHPKTSDQEAVTH